ncbi:GNAT family N-acetyltransferase [Alkalihalophilus marmarensis]|uniref:GNAT family N-acetyltransferase n=1 Tax=Alkalihalophilus marmarensis TaxID=521377 RepID=UPI002DB984BE|nr:hypothetical protein [Alkalihalophilus marmarensis]MEC2073498.1 hypothetical protein [Alkalihalophilus marmarensis]
MSIVVRRAATKDILPIQRLVARAGLSSAGIEHAVSQFLVVENEDEQIIGAVGIEQYEHNALMRSLVLDSPIWTGVLTLEFLQVALAYAKDQDIRTVYMCAKSSSPLFYQLDFKEVKKERIPKVVKQSTHYQQTVDESVRVWACELDD